MSGALSLNPSYYQALKRLTLEMAGISLGDNHEFLIETRLSALARREGFETLPDMVDELFSVGQTRLAVHVVSSLLERDTHFFDDRDSLNYVIEHCLPKLHPLYKGGSIRILSFGCSSGQEPVSMAIEIDKVKDRFPSMGIEIVGVDYPSVALDRARAGRYTHFEVQRGLPIRDLITYFDKVGEDWVVKEDLRKRLSFEDFHLLSKPDDLGAFHIVLFRNRLSLYSAPAQVRVMRSLSEVTQANGYLVLGSEETLGQLNYGFDVVGDHTALYRKREAVVEVVEDPSIKKPSDKTHFEGAKRRLRRYSDDTLDDDNDAVASSA
ncbi:protein-glutamate O-methyltransferase CheR [Fretibacter rubidus]|uniref:CheR family methyltransferase n=1 Tax=Fretibacter rubidus TaxID=570162 RepID=UPI00352AD95D